jgi:1-acyl-sn-glycerol-3-phosphate acyltransferase
MKMFSSIIMMLRAMTVLQLGSIVCFLLIPVFGRHRAYHLMSQSFGRYLSRLWGVRQELHGWDSLPEEIRSGRQNAVYIANHSSSLDPLLLACNLPNHPLFLAKREMIFVPVLGPVTWMWGSIFIDRGNRQKAIRSMDRAAVRIRRGMDILTFPEGTRTRSGALQPFKKGSFILALQTNVPVIPLAVTGAFRCLPPGEWKVNPGTFCIRVGTPLHPSDFPDGEGLKEAAERSMINLLSLEPV